MPDETNTSKTTAVSTMVDATMNDVQRGLAWFICISFIVLIFVWVFRPPVMAPESMAQLNQLVSTLQNILLLAIGFFFGSSKSSQNKDDALMKSALEPSAQLVPVTPVSTTTTTTDDSTVTKTEPAPAAAPAAPAAPATK